jgi:hypothetical protein
MTSRLALPIAIGSLVVAGWAIPPAGAADATDTPSGASAAMRAYVDPRTGELTTPPASAEQVEASSARAAAAGDLVEEAAPGGGTMVRLPGRFASPLVVTVEPGGGVRVGHGAGDRPDAR